MPNAMEKQTVENRKFFIIGGYGTGKSIFAASFPTPGFVFDFDNGIETYEGKDFDYEQYPLTREGWLKFEKDFKDVKEKATKGEYKTIIVDSTTSMTALAMEQAMHLDPKRSPTGGPLWNVHYQMVRNLMEGRLRQLTDLSRYCHIVTIAHINIIQDQESGSVIDIKPLLTGQLADIVPGYFSEVYYAITRRKEGKTEWLMQTVPVGLKMARSRASGKDHLLDDFIPNNYDAIIKQLKRKDKKHA